jgi:hypothetical protein
MRRDLFWYFLILCLLFVIMGCAAVHRSIDYYQTCLNDTECRAKMDQSRQDTSRIVFKALGSVPVASSSSNWIGDIAGLLASALTGLIAGRKLYKKRS